MIHYMCQACHRVVDWQTDVEATEPDRVEVKTIGNRFCVRCIVADAERMG